MSEKALPPCPPGAPWAHVLAAGVLLTALNALKPVYVDDPPFLAYAAEFAAHPLAPYAFHYGSPYVAPANALLAPPVFLYWLGAGIALLGDDPVVLKFWLLPFALALAWGVAELATRLAPALRTPLLWLALFSPAILPSFNFMLDVPALALGVVALALAVRGAERDSWPLTLAAGVCAGLAVQTKYTGAVSCAAVLLWFTLKGRPARGAAAVAVAAALAVGWECVLVNLQGESHFLVQFQQRRDNPLRRVLHLILPLLTHVAGLAPAAALLGLRALGWGGRGTVAAGAAVAAAFALLAVVPSQAALLTSASGKTLLSPSNVIYGLLAVLVWATFARVWLGLLRRDRTPDAPDRTLEWFLAAWFVLELGGAFALSPFPAARRVIGAVLVLTLAAGRLAHLRGVPARTAGRVAAFGVALGLLFFGADVLEARAGRAAAREVVRGAHRPAEGGTFWYLNWWGFSYYADRVGLRPLQLNRELPRPGDLLAIDDQSEFHAIVARHPEVVLEPLDVVVTGDPFPLRLGRGYYGGRTPVENHRLGRIRILVYRVTAVTGRAGG